VKKTTAFAIVMPGALAIAFALTACSSPEKEQRAEQRLERNQAGLSTAQHDATVDCSSTAQCDSAWALTKRYIEQHSSTSVTRADAFAIDTDVPSGSGDPAYSATRVAKGSGGAATLTLYAQCRGMYGPNDTKASDYNECAEKIIKIQNGYVDFLRSHLPGQ
jgi:hypothetical protein